VVGNIFFILFFATIGSLLIRRGREQLKEKKVYFKFSINWISMGTLDTHATAGG
jgi:hypothetical protein